MKDLQAIIDKLTIEERKELAAKLEKDLKSFRFRKSMKALDLQEG